MNAAFPFQVAVAVGLALSASAAMPAPISIDTSSSQNGLSEVYSTTFDGPLSPCGTGSPSYCSFFGGLPPMTWPASRRLLIGPPNPTGVMSGVPDGITPIPAAGSFLDLTLDAGHANVTIAGGVIRFPDLTITIADTTVVNVSGAGMVFNSAPQTTSVDTNGVAEFLVNLAPATAVDFSAFSVVVKTCSGPQCVLIPLLTLDTVRYRLFIDYDPTFASFTGSFIGDTANNSMVFANLNSVPVPAAVWLLGSALGVLGVMRRRTPG